MSENRKIQRKGVEDANQVVIKVGDTVRHLNFGRDAVVTSTHTRVTYGVRYNEIDIAEGGGPWDPKDVRKL